MGVAISTGAAGRVIGAAVVFLAVVIILGAGLHLSGVLILNVALYLSVLAVAASGVVLIASGKRTIAGAGAIIAALAAWLPFVWRTPPVAIVWTLGLIVGVALIARGTAPDSLRPGAWPLLVARFAVGWAFLDNAQSDQVWVPGGGGFLITATNAVKRGPLWPLDAPYLDFLKGTVIPSGDTWAGLFLGGELVFGLLVAVGLFSSVALIGTMWLSGNIVMEKSFAAHGAYVDKTYFLVEVFSFLTGAGLSYGIDASLRRLVPAWVARYLMGDREATTLEGFRKRDEPGLSAAPTT